MWNLSGTWNLNRGFEGFHPGFSPPGTSFLLETTRDKALAEPRFHLAEPLLLGRHLTIPSSGTVPLQSAERLYSFD